MSEDRKLSAIQEQLLKKQITQALEELFPGMPENANLATQLIPILDKELRQALNSEKSNSKEILTKIMEHPNSKHFTHFLKLMINIHLLIDNHPNLKQRLSGKIIEFLTIPTEVLRQNPELAHMMSKLIIELQKALKTEQELEKEIEKVNKELEEQENTPEKKEQLALKRIILMQQLANLPKDPEHIKSLKNTLEQTLPLLAQGQKDEKPLAANEEFTKVLNIVPQLKSPKPGSSNKLTEEEKATVAFFGETMTGKGKTVVTELKSEAIDATAKGDAKPFTAEKVGILTDSDKDNNETLASPFKRPSPFDTKPTPK